MSSVILVFCSHNDLPEHFLMGNSEMLHLPLPCKVSQFLTVSYGVKAQTCWTENDRLREPWSWSSQRFPCSLMFSPRSHVLFQSLQEIHFLYLNCACEVFFLFSIYWEENSLYWTCKILICSLISIKVAGSITLTKNDNKLTVWCYGCITFPCLKFLGI